MPCRTAWKPALTLSILALLGCGENTTPTEPGAVKDQAPKVAELAVGSYTWSSKANMPTARLALAVGVATNSSGQSVLYAIGGNSGSGSIRKVEAYNVATNTWTARAQLPIALQNSNGVGVIGGKLYLSGGQSAGASDVRVDLYVYDPSLNTWARKRNMPQALSHGATGVIGGKLYVHGVSGTTARLLRYDPVTNTWDQSLPGAPEAHQSGAGGVINGKFYLAGGAPSTGKLHVFDPATNRWTAKALMPGVARRRVSGAVLNGQLYIIGGQADNGTALATVKAYNPVNNSWSAKPPMPTARFAAGATRVVLNGEQRILVVGGRGVAALKATEAFGPIAACKQSISLLPGGFSLASQANTCTVALDQAGEYLAIPYYAEVQLPVVTTAAELPRTVASLHLTGGAPPQTTVAGRSSPARPQPVGEMLKPQLPGAVWYAPDFFVPPQVGLQAEAAAVPCVTPTVGSRLLVPTQRYGSGEFRGYYQDIGGPQETWRVARVTTEAIVAVDSAFWLRLPGDASASAALTALVQAWKVSVLPTMARFGIARRDLDGDGRTLILVPETPIGATAYTSLWGSNCSTPAEGILIPTSRFRGSSINPASMADGVNTMMHEMFHLYEWGARPPDYAWYASEGNARLAEHVWRVVTSSGGSPFTARRTTLPIGSYAGVSQQTITAQGGSKHCVEPTLDGFDYLRVYGNIRAYDTGCWFLGRVAARLEAGGVAENMIFPSLLNLAHQGTMVEMWNEGTGESRTPTAWRARWLAAMALEGSGLAPRDPTIRDPMWDLAAIIRGSDFASEARFILAPTLDAGTTTISWTIIDQSAQAARVRALAGGEIVLRNEAGNFFGSASSLQLLLVRLN